MSYFENHFKSVNEYKDKELTLSRIDNAIKYIPVNETDLGKIIHIAGSNGKGSTSSFISQLLQSYGYNVGLFTSPHLLKINERIQVNGVDISDIEFDNLFNSYKNILDEFSLTYFEAIFLLALAYFKERKLDYTIIETGLGGRYDATNTSTIKSKIAVVTKIAQDHTDVFGKNIYGILDEKLGIVRDNSPLFVAINTDTVISHIKQKLPLLETYFVSNSSFADGAYLYPYNENYQTAKTVVSYLLNREIGDIKLQLPIGRYEVHDKIIFDSTHNISGLLAVKKSNIINDIDVIIFTQTRERDIIKFISVLKTISDKLILTAIPNSVRSINIADIDDTDIYKFENPIDAYKYAKEIATKKILILGSFYLISYYKSKLTVDEL